MPEKLVEYANGLIRITPVVVEWNSAGRKIWLCYNFAEVGQQL